MTLTSIGNAAQQFITARNTALIKNDLSRLTNSLSSGRVADLSAELRGDTARYSGLQYALTQMEAFEQIAKETAVRLEAKQTALGQLENLRADLTERLQRVQEPSGAQAAEDGADAARATFLDMVNTLNLRFGDRNLFGGASVTERPLQSGSDMLADITGLIPPGATAEDIVIVVQGWFRSPAGGFATAGYLGDTGPPSTLRVSEVRSITETPRANDSRITAVLEAAAISAIVASLPALPEQARADLLATSARALLGSTADLTSVRAQIGDAEQAVATALAETGGKKTVFSMLKNDLDRADPFETATALQAIQLQLETHFTATARLSQLSLLRFL